MTQPCVEFIEFEGTGLPHLHTFSAVSDTTINTVGESEKELEWSSKTTRVSYKLHAPNVRSLTVQGYLGWDQVLFDSCSSKLEEVYIDLSNHNVEQVYDGGISSLRACKKLTLRTIFSLHSIMGQSILHPFAGYYDEESETPAKNLIKLEELILIRDENINGHALLKFVRYKTKIGAPLLKLVVKECPQVRGNTIVTLQREIKECTVESKVKD